MTTDIAEDVDTLGVINALERICELESRMRQAIQQTHPLTTTMDWDFQAADREREALLHISEHLEYLEDKLRDLRFNGNTNSENKAVILSQLDTARRELIEVIQRGAPNITFGNDVLRDVAAFAAVDGGSPINLNTPRGSTSKSNYLTKSSAAPTAANNENGAVAGSMFTLLSSPSRRHTTTPPARPGTAGTTSTLSPSRHSLHDNDLWEEDHHTASTSVAAAGGHPRQQQQQSIQYRRPPSGLSFPNEPYPSRPPSSYAREDESDQVHFMQQYRSSIRGGASSPQDRDSVPVVVPPLPPVPSVDFGTDDGRSSEISGASSPGRDLLNTEARAKRKLNLKSLTSFARRSKGGGSKRDMSSPVKITDEDIYGPPPLPSARSTTYAGSSNAMESPRDGVSGSSYGGVLRIQEMLDRAERGLKEVAEKQEQRRVPARILPEPDPNNPNAAGTTVAGSNVGEDDVLSQFGGSIAMTGTVYGGGAPSMRDWQIGGGGGDSTYTPRSTFDFASPRSERTHNDRDSSRGGGVGSVVTKLAGLAFVLGSIAAATMAVTALAPSGGAGGGGSKRDEENNNRSTVKRSSKSGGGAKRSDGSTRVRRAARSATAATTTAGAVSSSPALTTRTSKDASNKTNNNDIHTTAKSKRSSSGGNSANQPPADIPPWAEDGDFPPLARSSQGGSPLRQGGIAGGSRRGGGMSVSSSSSMPAMSPGRSRRSAVSKGQAPVQNVADPPVTPSPDVRSVMG